jgi:hypothetical protein
MNIKSAFPHTVGLSYPDEQILNEFELWCKENIPHIELWYAAPAENLIIFKLGTTIITKQFQYEFSFLHESDAMLFKLRWSEYCA